MRPGSARTRIRLGLGLLTAVQLLLGTAVPAPLSAGAAASSVAPHESSAPDSSPSVAPPVQLRKLSLGVPVTPPNMVHLPPYVANDTGLFREVGLEVEFKNFEGGVQALRGGMAGGLDVIGTSADPIIAAATRGAGIKAIGTYAPKLSVIMVGQQDVRGPADLRGKRIGIQEVGGFNEVMSRAVLATVGMTPENVRYVTVT
jgi:NitT/TauT family transport system substrate-binding protein